MKRTVKHPAYRRIVRIVDDLPKNHWMARQLPRGTSLRRYAEDHAVTTLTKAAHDAIVEAGLTRAEVADLLGTTRSYVSQVLNGSTNMTLKTFGSLLWAAGQQVGAVQREDVATEHSHALLSPGTTFVYDSSNLHSAGHDTMRDVYFVSKSYAYNAPGVTGRGRLSA